MCCCVTLRRHEEAAIALEFDVGLDPVTGDLPVFPVHISGTDLVLQRITIRLQRFLGEWMLDTTVGLPYLAWTQQRPLDIPGITAVLRAEIAGTPGVLRVDNFTGTFNFNNQTLSFVGLIVLDNEDAVTSEILVPATVSGNTTPAVIMFHRSGFIAA